LNDRVAICSFQSRKQALTAQFAQLARAESTISNCYDPLAIDRMLRQVPRPSGLSDWSKNGTCRLHSRSKSQAA